MISPIQITPSDLKDGVAIQVLGFKGDVGSMVPTQVFLELGEGGRLAVHVWTGNEDPTQSFLIERSE